MGYVKNHAIIITGPLDDVKKVRKYAQTLCADLVTPIVEYIVNVGGSFAVLPDGSKEGWEESFSMDENRKKIKEFIKTMDYEDGSNPLDWVEVSFDEGGRKKVEG